MDIRSKMKTLGHSPNGGIIIELTPKEARALHLAEKTLSGAVHWEIFCSPSGPSDEAPIANIFKALYGWIGTKMAVNELQKRVDQINDALGVKQ